MHQITRTLAFVIAASLSVLGAVATYYITRPPVVEGYDLVGQEFYPDFQDPTRATAIRVAGWNERSQRVEQFEVRYENGQWQIPSHYNYPADGRDQLARAAASAVGIVRGSKVSGSSDTHERMGVIDPDDKSAVQGNHTTGTRITLYEGEEVLADFIIGNPREPGDGDEGNENGEAVGRQEKEGIYYVRTPGKEDVYLAEVKIDVSTRFADWIQKNLLDLTSGDLREISLDRYSVDEATGTVKEGVRSELTRKTASEPWTLADLDAEKEKLKTSVVNAMARALDDLRIVGVRPKPAGLSAQLRQTEGASLTQQVVLDLQQKGFFLARGGELLSNEGEVHAGTADGVLYVLRFGEVFTGSDLEVEVGQTKTDDDEPSATTPTDPEAAKSETEQATKDQSAANAETPDEESKPAPSTQSSRFVFVTAQLKPELLGDVPVEPKKPEPPAAAPAQDAAPNAEAAAKPELKPNSPANAAPSTDDAAPKADAPAEAATDSDDCQDDAPPAAAPAQPAANPPAGDAPVEPAPQPKTPQQLYEEALKDYEAKLEVYKAQKDEYDRRLEEAQTRVAELNDRFADWYYVIPADIFEDLRVPREQLVEPADPPMTPDAPSSTPAASPAPMAPAASPAPMPPAASASPMAPAQPAAGDEPATPPMAEKKDMSENKPAAESAPAAPAEEAKPTADGDGPKPADAKPE